MTTTKRFDVCGWSHVYLSGLSRRDPEDRSGSLRGADHSDGFVKRASADDSSVGQERLSTLSIQSILLSAMKLVARRIDLDETFGSAQRFA